METVWIPEAEFKAYIWSFGDNAQIEAYKHFNRWVITREDGTKYVARPLPANAHQHPTEVSQ